MTAYSAKWAARKQVAAMRSGMMADSIPAGTQTTGRAKAFMAASAKTRDEVQRNKAILDLLYVSGAEVLDAQERWALDRQAQGVGAADSDQAGAKGEIATYPVRHPSKHASLPFLPYAS